MGDKSSNIESMNATTSTCLVGEQDNGNKTNFVPEMSVDSPVGSPTPSITEFPKYEVSQENSSNTLSELHSASPEGSVEDQESEKGQQADWMDPISFQLEELLTNNLMEACESAVKKIIECGFTREVAEWAILNSGVFYGSKDTASNLAEGALILLKRDQEFNTPKHSVFDGFQRLIDYTLLEMIHVILEIRPGLTISEAMWCLLISDMNLLSVCVAEKESTKLPDSKAELSGTNQSDSNKLDGLEQSNTAPDAENSRAGTNASVAAENPPKSESQPSDLASSKVEDSIALQEEKGQTTGVYHEKSGVSYKKGATNPRRDMLRQKAIQFDKSFKGRMSKGAFKAKVTAWGNMVLDKSMNLQSSSSNVVAKGARSKPSNSFATNGPLCEEKLHPSSNTVKDNPSRDSQFGVEDAPPSEKDSVDASASTKSDSCASSLTERHSLPKIKTDVFSSFKTIDYLLNIPFDETLRKFVPQDQKDEAILMLIPHKHKLKKEVKSWTTWANEKVMEVAKRLGKDQVELKMLRQEKEDLEKLKRDQQNTEESNLKRLSEMEHALANATSQIHMAHLSLRRLERDNSVLKERLEVARTQALVSAVNLDESVVREQDAMRKMQSWDADKAFLLKQSNDLKRVAAELGNKVEKAKEREVQFKTLLKLEEKEKEKFIKQIESLKQKKEEDNALTKEEEDNIKRAAETNKLKCIEEIKNLEAMISKMSYESERSKIAALNIGYGNNLTTENKSTASGLMLPKLTKRLAVFQGNFGGTVKPERECVMCMTKEISVVFLPCAHQVLCDECNGLHEKQGLIDCPSCRTMIQKRISVCY